MRDNLMSSRNLSASLVACFLAVGIFDIAPAANAVSAGPSILKPGESAGNNAIEIKYRRRAPRMYVPIGPSYLFYDYAYYYSRGYYPTHIAPHYIFYGPYGRILQPKYAGRCSTWRRGCVAGWTYYRGSRYSRR